MACRKATNYLPVEPAFMNSPKIFKILNQFYNFNFQIGKHQSWGFVGSHAKKNQVFHYTTVAVV